LSVAIGLLAAALLDPARCPPKQIEAEASRRGEKKRGRLREDADDHLQRVQRGVLRRRAEADPLPLRMAPLQPQAQGIEHISIVPSSAMAIITGQL